MSIAATSPSHQINIRLDPESHSRLLALAKRLQCPPATALKRFWEKSGEAGEGAISICFEPPPPTLSEAQEQALVALAGLGRNINQITHQMHMNRLNGAPQKQNEIHFILEGFRFDFEKIREAIIGKKPKEWNAGSLKTYAISKTKQYILPDLLGTNLKIPAAHFIALFALPGVSVSFQDSSAEFSKNDVKIAVALVELGLEWADANRLKALP